MSDNAINSSPLTEDSSRLHHVWTLATMSTVALLLVLGALRVYREFTPLQQHYLPRYFVAASGYPEVAGYRIALVTQDGQAVVALPDDVARDDAGELALSESAAARGRSDLRFVTHKIATITYFNLLKTHIYTGTPPQLICASTLRASAWAYLVLALSGLPIDLWANHRRRRGILRRGPRLISPGALTRAVSADGIGFRVTRPIPTSLSCLRRFLPSSFVRIPRKDESSHMLVVGATGTGKSQLLDQLLRQIRDRGETAIIYDPDGEFLAEFYDEARGDLVLNPMDQRCPYWSPSDELASNYEAYTLAEALFPDPSHADDKNTFFIRAPRQILARLFEYAPTPGELVQWLADFYEVDRRVRGTEMEAMLSKAAGPQRMGIFAALGIALNAFRLLPTKEATTRTWSAREWSKTRQGWLFITSAETTRAIQLPLISMWLDTLLLRLMTRLPEGAEPKPVWLLIDELASLRKLPTLQAALTRARKYKVRTVLGFQGQSQMQEIYGREAAETIMGMPKTTVFFRTKEPLSAEWVSKSLGDQEIAREKVNRSDVGVFGRKRSNTYSIEIKTERAVTPAQILGLPDLHGYLKIAEYIAPFRLCLVQRPQHVPPFVPRPSVCFTPYGTPQEENLEATDSQKGQDDSRPAAPVPAGQLPPSVAAPTLRQDLIVQASAAGLSSLAAQLRTPTESQPEPLAVQHPPHIWDFESAPPSQGAAPSAPPDAAEDQTSDEH